MAANELEERVFSENDEALLSIGPHGQRVDVLRHPIIKAREPAAADLALDRPHLALSVCDENVALKTLGGARQRHPPGLEALLDRGVYERQLVTIAFLF